MTALILVVWPPFALWVAVGLGGFCAANDQPYTPTPKRETT